MIFFNYTGRLQQRLPVALGLYYTQIAGTPFLVKRLHLVDKYVLHILKLRVQLKIEAFL